jgi:hypothetical protein
VPGAGPGGPGGPGGGRGGFDPKAIFTQRDADSDGFITESEASDRMKQNFSSIDTNSDGKVSLDEFTASMAQFGRGRGGPPGGGEGGPGGGGAPGGPPGGAPGGGGPPAGGGQTP